MKVRGITIGEKSDRAFIAYSPGSLELWGPGEANCVVMDLEDRDRMSGNNTNMPESDKSITYNGLRMGSMAAMNFPNIGVCDVHYYGPYYNPELVEDKIQEERKLDDKEETVLVFISIDTLFFVPYIYEQGQDSKFIIAERGTRKGKYRGARSDPFNFSIAALVQIPKDQPYFDHISIYGIDRRLDVITGHPYSQFLQYQIIFSTSKMSKNVSDLTITVKVSGYNEKNAGKIESAKELFETTEYTPLPSIAPFLTDYIFTSLPKEETDRLISLVSDGKTPEELELTVVDVSKDAIVEEIAPLEMTEKRYNGAVEMLIDKYTRIGSFNRYRAFTLVGSDFKVSYRIAKKVGFKYVFGFKHGKFITLINNV